MTNKGCQFSQIAIMLYMCGRCDTNMDLKSLIIFNEMNYSNCYMDCHVSYVIAILFW